MTGGAKGWRAMEHRVCVAPMMDHTDRHFRYFLRLIAPRVGLYTEMITAQALLHGPAERLLAFSPSEQPVALQLGGSEPDALERAAALAASGYRYAEINLNVGCPSDRVQSGRFGACLMAEPALVAECVAAIRCGWPGEATVKTRIGIDSHDDYDFLQQFVAAVADAGCHTVIVHARKAILKGLSPKENRTIPPLRYDVVYRLKQDFPSLRVVINGGIESMDDCRRHLSAVDGVMIGRKACSDPCFLRRLDDTLFAAAERPAFSRAAVVAEMADYAASECSRGVRLHHITRHMFGLFAGQPGAARWRRYLAEHAAQPRASARVLGDALKNIRLAA